MNRAIHARRRRQLNPSGRGALHGESSSPPGRSIAGFSLLEMLVVVGLMITIMALYWHPNSGGRQRQLKADCQNHLQKTFMALDIYAQDFSGKFPEVSGAQSSREPLALLVPRYNSDPSVFRCPGSKENEVIPNRTSYAYYMGRRIVEPQQVLMTDRQVDSKAKAVGDYAFSKDGNPPGNNHGQFGGNLLFCDGHVQSSPARLAFPLPLTNGVVLLNP